MTILSPDTIRKLCGDYSGFVDAVRFREGEEFYSHDFPVLELSYNENPLGPGKLARETIRRHVEFAHRYPPLGYSILLNELAGRLSLNPDQVIVTAGSVTAIYLAVAGNADAGEKVVFSKSSIPWYRWSTLATNSTPDLVPLAVDMNHDLDALLEHVDPKTKVVIISNPHNPTGLYIGEEELRAFHSRLPEEVLLIVDQAYYEYQAQQETVLLGLVRGGATNLLLTRTFSKIHGLAGLRIGYGIANAELIRALKARWLAFMPAIGSLSSYAAYHALFDQEHLDESRRFNDATKEAIYALASGHGLQFLRSEANFVAVNIRDSRVNEKLLQENGMAFTPGYFFGYPEWARLSFDRRRDEMLRKLDSAFQRIGERRHE